MNLLRSFRANRYGLTYLVYLVAAVATGAGCAWFMRGFDFVSGHRIGLSSLGPWCWLATPALFLIAAELIQRTAPFAVGAGISQVVFAGQNLSSSRQSRLLPLVSLKTMAVKAAAVYLAIYAGASAGPEGPSVQVAACLFVSLVLVMARILKLDIDLRSAVVGGGAAGLAAAFHTPVAGVAFAIEELTGERFSNIKDYVLMAIIVVTMASEYVLGPFRYIAKVGMPDPVPARVAVAIGLLGGFLGLIFSEGMLRLRSAAWSLRGPKRRLLPVAFGAALVALSWFCGADVLGAGHEQINRILQGPASSGRWDWNFTAGKMAATVLTQSAGVAGGALAPILSIGAAMGAAAASGLGASTVTCAMVGMAAFMSGTIQAPITAFVIVFELTGHHRMILPVMLGAAVAYAVARTMGGRNFYETLAAAYGGLVEKKQP